MEERKKAEEPRMVQLIEGNGFPLAAKKINPNAPCECGSGKKAKKCCGYKTTYIYSKLNKKQMADLKIIQEAELKKKQKELEEAGLVDSHEQ